MGKRKTFPSWSTNMGVRCDQGAHDKVNVVIVHETQGATIEGGLSALKNRSDGSAHELVGPDAKGNFRRIRLASDFRILCHTGGQNTNTYGVEKAGISAWKKAFRLASKKERFNIALAAYVTAQALKRHDIPARYLGVKDLKRFSRAGAASGWTYHRDCSYAFGTTSHTDPGVPNVSWPHSRFKKLVRFYRQHPHVNHEVSMGDVRRASKRNRHE